LHAASGVRVTEIALAERAAFGPLRSSSDALLVVIEGGGWLAVADERQRVAVGESIEVPAGAERLLVTDSVPLRAIFIEFSFAPQLQQADAPNGNQAEE
jgi:quercetin dioxygenase-like cupin family protein